MYVDFAVKWYASENRFTRTLAGLGPYIFAGLGLLYLSNLSGHWQWEWDSAYYLTIAKSFLAGNGFTYLGYPCLKSPPGFPLLISPVMWLFKSDIFFLNAFILLCALVALALIYRFFKKYFSAGYAVLVTAGVGVSSLTLLSTGFIMVDIPYLAVSMAALLLLTNYLNHDRRFRVGLMAVIIILAAFFLRSIGIALVAGTAAYVLLHKRSVLRLKGFWLLALLLIVPIGIWSWYSATIKIDLKDPVWQLTDFIPPKLDVKRLAWDDPTSRVNGATDIVKRGLKNMTYYAGETAVALTGIQFDMSVENLNRTPKLILALLLVPFCITGIGFASVLLQGRALFNYYVLAYFAVLFIWSGREPRYLVPVLPFFVHYFITGMLIIASFLKTMIPIKSSPRFTFEWGAAIVYLLFFTAMNLPQDITITQSRHGKPGYPQYRSDLLNAAQWINAHTPSGARMVSVDAPVAAYFSGRYCTSYPWVGNESEIARFLAATRTEYVIVSDNFSRERRFLSNTVAVYGPGPFTLVYHETTVSLYRINQDSLQRLIGGAI